MDIVFVWANVYVSMPIFIDFTAILDYTFANYNYPLMVIEYRWIVRIFLQN